ncbi:MAG: hydroxymethylglutaryl-CoA lyase [Myxococcales bacterium]|nr:hydroxymethylglutaryl-CoA lyase [Myxococcales bacterium]
MAIPKRVRVVEVGPRDGLQNEPTLVPAADKVAFIDRLTAAGLPFIEATSFVSPRWVPQLADAALVYPAIQKKPGVIYSVLVPNLVGLQRALDAGAQHIAVFTAASETFNQHNINASVDESLVRIGAVVAAARERGIPVRGYVSTSFGCPYEGAVKASAVADVAARLFELGLTDIALGDTHGGANPTLVTEVLDAVLKRVPLETLGVHFHDTHGRALANVYVALTYGIATVDASAGGLGGCPYAPGASGNLATEDLLVMLHEMGIETGVDLSHVLEACFWMETVLGRRLTSRHLQVARAQRL